MEGFIYMPFVIYLLVTLVRSCCMKKYNVTELCSLEQGIWNLLWSVDYFKYRHISKELIHKIISFNKILMLSSRPAVVLQNENEKKINLFTKILN